MDHSSDASDKKKKGWQYEKYHNVLHSVSPDKAIIIFNPEVGPLQGNDLAVAYLDPQQYGNQLNLFINSLINSEAKS